MVECTYVCIETAFRGLTNSTCRIVAWRLGGFMVVPNADDVQVVEAKLTHRERNKLS